MPGADKNQEGAKKIFLLDTGAFDNTITPDVAREVTRLHRAARGDVFGMNGELKLVYVAGCVTSISATSVKLSSTWSPSICRISRQADTEIQAPSAWSCSAASRVGSIIAKPS